MLSRMKLPSKGERFYLSRENTSGDCHSTELSGRRETNRWSLMKNCSRSVNDRICNSRNRRNWSTKSWIFKWRTSAFGDNVSLKSTERTEKHLTLRWIFVTTSKGWSFLRMDEQLFGVELIFLLDQLMPRKSIETNSSSTKNHGDQSLEKMIVHRQNFSSRNRFTGKAFQKSANSRTALGDALLNLQNECSLIKCLRRKTLERKIFDLITMKSGAT